jgi:hypothetical protein
LRRGAKNGKAEINSAIPQCLPTRRKPCSLTIELARSNPQPDSIKGQPVAPQASHRNATGVSNKQDVCMFVTTGLIANPNAPRVAQPPAAPYGPANTPVVQCGNLAQRNRQYYKIGTPAGATAAISVPLACHHVIGWDIIWGFWNALITNEEFLVARSYLALFGAAQATTSKLESQIKNNKFVSGANWEQQLCWKPNNIVRGPNDRSDDPNANVGLENKIDFQKARADIYKGRVAGLAGAGRDMCEYIKSAKIDKAREAITYFKSIQNEEIMEWDESIWAVDSKLPGYSSTPSPAGGFLVVRPTWRIHISKA